MSLADFRRDVERGALPAVGKLAILLRNEVTNNLSTPGRGKFYAKRRNAGAGVGPRTRAEVNARTFNRRLSRVVGSLNAGVSNISAVAKSYIKNLHRASAPGDPPAPDLGTLKRSVFIERTATGYIIGVAARTGIYLERGTLRIKPRPFLRPALARVRRQLGVFVSEIQKIVAANRAERGARNATRTLRDNNQTGF